MSVVGEDRDRLLADQEEVLARTKPKTFDELRALPITCKRCGAHTATHTVSMTVAVVGKGRGSIVTTIPKAPVCEPCGVELVVVFKKALRA